MVNAVRGDGPSPPPNGDIMDLLVVLAESWILLLLIPLAAVLAAYAVVASNPVQYRASTTIRLMEAAPTLVNAPDFLAALGPAAPVDGGRIYAFNNSTALTTEIVNATTDAAAAQATVAAATKALKDLARANLSELEKEIEIASDQIVRLTQVIAHFEQYVQSSAFEATEPPPANAMAQAIVTLSEGIASGEASLAALEAEYAATTAELGAPTAIVVTPIARDWRPVLAALLAGASFAAAIVYIRYLLSEAALAPDYDARRRRILRALFLVRPPKSNGGNG